MSLTPATRTLVRGAFGDLVFASFGYVVAIFAFSSTYSAPSLTSTQFSQQYWHGVYASRIVGRELTVLVYNVLSGLGSPNPLLRLAPPWSHGENYFSAVVIVNYVGLAVFTILIGLWLRKSTLLEVQVSHLMMGAIALVTASLYVVTPYDTLSFAFMVATLLLAFRGGRWQALALPFVVLGCLTRESEFLAIALIVAVTVWRPSRVSRTLALWVAAVSALTYVTVHLAYRAQGGLLEHGLTWYVAKNLHGEAQSYAGVIVAALAIGAWLVMYRRSGLASMPNQSDLRRIRLTFLALASPYILVVVDSGRWYESLRLLIPVLLADLFIPTSGIDKELPLSEGVA